mgnify:CR=1 FL=1
MKSIGEGISKVCCKWNAVSTSEKNCCNLKIIEKEITAFLNYLAVVKIILLKLSGKGSGMAGCGIRVYEIY